MRIAQPLMLTLALLVSGASYANTATDTAKNAVINEHQAFVNGYATDTKRPLPSIVDYTYGMKLDIAKVVRLSPDMKTCGVMPQLMTYEDSSGELKTLKYQVMSGCKGKN